MDELVGLAAVEQSSDGGQGVQDDGLRMGINVVLIFFLKKEEKKTLSITCEETSPTV